MLKVGSLAKNKSIFIALIKHIFRTIKMIKTILPL